MLTRRGWLTGSVGALAGMCAAFFARRTETATAERETTDAASLSVSCYSGATLNRLHMDSRWYVFDPPMTNADAFGPLPDCSPGECVTINGQTGAVVRRER